MCKRHKRRPVDIGYIEAFVFDEVTKKGYELKDVFKNEKKDEKLKNKKVAIIGGGPSALTVAAFLAKEGIQVTIYERKSYLGGLLVYGIPDLDYQRKL